MARRKSRKNTYCRILVDNKKIGGIYSFQRMDSVLEYKGSECIIVKDLDPDYTILLSRVKLIISAAGSPLSHLAIMAREYKKSIILVPDHESLKIFKKRGNIKAEVKDGKAYIALL